MYIGYEKEIATIVDAIIAKQSSVWACGVEIKLSNYHTSTRTKAVASANEIIGLLHTPTQTVKKRKPKKRKPKGKRVNGILYLI